jgi:hypothetical protein
LKISNKYPCGTHSLFEANSGSKRGRSGVKIKVVKKFLKYQENADIIEGRKKRGCYSGRYEKPNNTGR